jgi:tetratricopeptide (TPR) repeat protein
MPSHVYMLLGDYAAAAESNKIAAHLDHQYITKEQVKGVYPMLYFHHNLHFNAAANMMLGRYSEAKDAARQLAASLAVHAADITDMQTYITEYFGPYPTFVALRFNDWPSVLSAPQPDAGLPISNGFWHYARGVAFSATGELAKAETERDSLAKLREALPEGSVYGLNPGADILNIGLSVLDGRIALAKSDRKAAISNFEAAVAMQDKIAYNEPADWYYPVRETLGAALLIDGQPARAEEVFRADLLKTRRNARSLFGLHQALLAQGKTEHAELVRRQFEREWHPGEPGLNIREF